MCVYVCIAMPQSCFFFLRLSSVGFSIDWLDLHCWIHAGTIIENRGKNVVNLVKTPSNVSRLSLPSSGKKAPLRHLSYSVTHTVVSAGRINVFISPLK